jgi:hypothetical protein
MKEYFKMRLIGIVLVVLSITASYTTVLALEKDVHKTVVTRWIDTNGAQPTTYKMYKSSRALTPLIINELKSFTLADDSIGMLIVVNNDLYPLIAGSLDIYVQDLQSDGYQATVTTVSGGSPSELRTYLAQQWQNGISGVLLVGDLPIPWFEMYEDFDNDSIPDDQTMVEFPIDLFYMDLDGDWLDEDDDDLFDGHTGSWQPDIWCGRLMASPLTTADEVALINDYLARNHSYRTGTLYLPFRALCYIDDDWESGVSEWIRDVERAYGLITPITDKNQTTADNYRVQLTNQYDHILLASHSSPWSHALKENSGQNWGYFYNYEISGIDPPVFFYNLFACSNCRYVENDNMGACYLFQPNYGLGVLGSTKTGSMLYFGDYYGPLGSGATIGESFRSWFALHGNEPGAEMWSRSWFYGMTLLGDPTLKPNLGLKYLRVTIDDDQEALSSGDGDGIPDAGETIELSIEVYNFDSQSYQQVDGLLFTDDGYISITDSTGSFGTINSEDSSAAAGFFLNIAENCPDQHRIKFSLYFSDNEDHEWLDHFELEVKAPKFDLLAADYKDQSGDGLIQPGERVGILFTLANRGGDDSPMVNGSLDCPGNHITIITGNTSFDSLQSNEEVTANDSLWVEVSPDCPHNTTPLLRLNLKPATADSIQRYIALPIGSEMTLLNDLEDTPDGFRNYKVSNMFENDWHRSTQRYYTGGYSYKFGNQVGGTYSPLADGALETPLFYLWPNAELTFWHWMDVESGYDGGIVELNTGIEWIQIEPIGGYPFHSVSNGSFPSTGCYSGQFDWTKAAFNLSADSGWARLRFRFGSDGGLEKEGWYIDNLEITGTPVGIKDPESSLSKIPRIYDLSQNYPNPFNAITEIKYALPKDCWVKIEVYNIIGQKVAVLVDGKQKAGYKTTNWNGTSFSSGIYFYRIQAGKFVRTKKMVMLK